MDFQIINQSGIFPNNWIIGSLDIYFPNPNSRINLRNEIEYHLRTNYNPGTYIGNQANEISKHLFCFYNSEFKKTIHLIDDPFFIYFTLFNFDKATKIEYQFRNHQLNKEDSILWKKKGPLYRRTLSYLLDEMISRFKFPITPQQPFAKSLMDYDRLFLLSEKAIEYSTISNEIFYLNESYKIKVNPSGSQYFIESINTKESRRYSALHNCYLRQTSRDSKLREKFLIGKPYEQDWIKHGEFLNESFTVTMGISYNEFMFLLTSIILNTKPIEDENDIPLVKKDHFLSDIASQLNLTVQQINNFFEGLILKKEHFRQNIRTFTKFKQMYRVAKRPFLEIRKSDGTFLTWSNEMVKERLTFLDNDFIFKSLPPEWNNKMICQSVNKISNDAGKWFEKQVKQNFISRGIVGDKIKDKILPNNGLLNCRMVGGFDFLGYSATDNIILLIECKFINPGFEPKSYNDDLKAFTNPSNGYIKKMDKKLDWVIKNFSQTKVELEGRFKIRIPDSCCTIGSAFFTYINTFAFAFIPIYPCVSFTEFFFNFDLKNKWYFKTGITKIYA